MKNTCQNLIQQYQNIILLKQEFVFICKKGVETKDFTKLKEVKKELGRRVKELQENIEIYLDQTVEYLENNMTRRSKRVIVQLQKAMNEGAKEVGEEPQIIGEDLPIGDMDEDPIELDEEGEILVLDLDKTKITSLDNVTFPDSLEELYLNNTKITSLDSVKLPDGLKHLSLDGTQITSLDSVKLPNSLEGISLIGTPLAKDPAKLQALKAKYPNIRRIST